MIHPLWEIVRRAKETQLESLGTTALAVGIGLAIQAIRLLLKFYSEVRTKGWREVVTNHRKERLKEALITFGLPAAAWVILFAINVNKVVTNDYARLNQLVKDNEELKNRKPPVDGSDNTIAQLQNQLAEAQKRKCPSSTPKQNQSSVGCPTPGQAGSALQHPVFMNPSDPEPRNTLYGISAFLYFQPLLPENAGGVTKECRIKITSPKENNEVRNTFAALAAVARCHVDGQQADDMRPEIEEAALQGAVPNTILIHAPKKTRYEEGSSFLNYFFHVKRKYDVIDEGKPTEEIWIQIGAGNIYQDHPLQSEIHGGN